MKNNTWKTIYSSRWMARISRVLIFTLLFGTIMHQGWQGPREAQAAITYEAEGTVAYSATSGTSVAPAYPGMIAAGDLLVLIVGMKPSTANGGSVTTPTGWTPIVSLTGAGGYGTTLAVDTGNTNLFTFYKIASGTETGALTVTIATNSVSWAQIYRFSDYDGAWSVAGATGSDATGDAAVSIAFGANPGVTVNDYILGAMCIPTDVTTPAQFSAEGFTQTGATFGAVIEITEPDSANGNDIGGFVVYAPVNAGTATGNPTMTATATGTLTNVRGPGVFIRVREAFLPPVAGTVTVSPESGSYTSAAPTISAVFTDNEPALQSCEYTTNGGANWFLGTVSGYSPYFICTAGPTGLSGTLTINMRATSQGGVTTATSIARTVDSTGPTDGILTVTPENRQNALSWTAAVDAGAGLRTANTYEVRFLAGAAAPTCTTGTVIYTGSRTSALHTGLTNGAQYSYRVCAYDAFDNRSAGAIGSGTPVAWGMSSCAACHGSLEVFTDGSNRNNPAGTFVGSHNKHVIVYEKSCTACHAGNIANNHRNGAIDMSAVGYGKGASFVQVNAPTPYQACATTYCHSQGAGVTGQSGDTRTLASPIAALTWGQTGACGSCHASPPNYANGTASWGTPTKANSHGVHTTDCQTCHSATTVTGNSIANTSLHVNQRYDIAAGPTVSIQGYTYAATGGTCSNVSCHGGSALGFNNVNNAAWGASLGCTTCHDKAVYAPKALLASGGAVRQRDNAVAEFGLAWGHRNSVRSAASGTVKDADCIVCHLEGEYASQRTSLTYHGNGYIDLRDPDGSGETPITRVSSSATFSFTKFQTSYAAGSRTSTGHTSDNIDNVLTQKFCLACHDSNGAINPTARSNNGGTGTQYMPFGGINLGANYTVVNGAAYSGGLVNVYSQLSTTNTSYHPVRGPLNRDFPWSSRLAVPYNNIGTTRDANNATTHVMANSVVLNCFDCHTSGKSLIKRTIVAHGNAATLRGTVYGSLPSLCTTCHIGGTYTGAVEHGAGSANQQTGNQISTANNDICSNCHASATTRPARPLPAQDYHGQSTLVGGANWPAPGGKVYAFMRNTGNFAAHRPYRSAEFTTGNATCTAGTGCGTMGTYTPGGTF